MADDDNELFEAALATPEQEAPQVEVTPEAPEGDRPRDEHGRFKAQNEPEAPAVEQQQVEPERPAERESQGIPSWRLKEEAEARRAAEERANQAQQRAAEFERRIAEFERNKQPQAVPDMYEDPNGFVDHGVRKAVDPLNQQMNQLREFYSRKEAIRDHGAEKVDAAYDALAQGMQSRDPEVYALYQRAMSSLDPYGEIVKWHTKQTLFSQVGTDPDAFVDRRLDERLKDPAFQAKIMERIRGQAQASNRQVTQLPPSLNRATSAAPPGDDDGDESEAGLLKSALRR